MSGMPPPNRADQRRAGRPATDRSRKRRSSEASSTGEARSTRDASSPREASPAPVRLTLSVQTGKAAGDWPVDRSQLRRWVQAALEHEAQITLRLVGRREGRALNLAWRAKDYATNVLTFAYGGQPLQADIVLCLPVIRTEARAQGKQLRDHLAHLVIHGVLHAQGHDHERVREAQRMESLETRLLARFRIADPYALGHTRGLPTP